MQCAAINKGLAIAASIPQARCWSANWLFRMAGVDLSNHSLLLLLKMTMGDDNNGDDYDSTCVGSHAKACGVQTHAMTAAVRPRMQLQSAAATRICAASIMTLFRATERRTRPSKCCNWSHERLVLEGRAVIFILNLNSAPPA